MEPKSINPVAMRVCAWCGPAIMVLFCLGFAVVGHFVPPPSPSDSAEVIASWYRDNATTIRIGLLLSMVAVSLVAPWGASLAVWSRRRESDHPVLTYTQLICIAGLLVASYLTCLVFAVAAFRPDEVATETTRLFNDFGWFLFLWTWPPISVWCLAIALSVFFDESENPPFPRWIAYFNFWIAFLLIPAGLIVFVKDGPFGFNGVVAFWIPVVVFFGWMLVMTRMVLLAVSAEAQRLRGPSRAAEMDVVHTTTGQA